MFYTYTQNNSGGYFIQNNDVRQFVIVEADNAEQANLRANDIVEDYREYCQCCGERWYINCSDEDGKEVAMIYDTPVTQQIRKMYIDSCIIYYANNTKEIIIFDY